MLVLTYKNTDQKSLRNGVLFVLAWVTCVVCFCGQRACMGGVGGMLVVGCVLACVACLRRCHAFIFVIIFTEILP